MRLLAWPLAARPQAAFVGAVAIADLVKSTLGPKGMVGGSLLPALRAAPERTAPPVAGQQKALLAVSASPERLGQGASTRGAQCGGFLTI